MGRSLKVIFSLAFLLGLWALPSWAQTPDYRSFYGLNSRLIIWIIAELHLMFAAFVLGVPIFAVIVEVIGVRTRDKKYDDLAREFTKLLMAAFSITAAFGGLLAFCLFGLYPSFMNFLFNIFHTTYYIYGLLFFGEGFTLYLYYYSWDRLMNRKGLHITLGVLLNVFGTALLVIANSWASYMMSPTGIKEGTLAFEGTLWEALNNPLWTPLNLHRLLANVVFGGFIVGAYGAIKFLRATTFEEKAHYDWMGYIGNFIGTAALITLPFAGYYMGREVYSASPVMGNIMMGGTFSWSFVIQAILIGILFIGANYYLWDGMQRIEGAERYKGYTKYINAILIFSFAVWLTPHNLPLKPAEQIAMGGQYHPVLKYLGLMPAKNAVVNWIILSTFLSFLLYRRGNKGKPLPFREHGLRAKVILIFVGVICLLFLGYYARSLLNRNPVDMGLSPEKKVYFILPAVLLLCQGATLLITLPFNFFDKGKLVQNINFVVTILFVVFVLGVYGFVVMEKANPLLRGIAVVQVLMVLSCIFMNSAIDIFLFRGAEEVGRIYWGRATKRSQFALIILCITVVMLMGLMGFIRSGLREDWHVYGILRDTSEYAFTPTMAYMTKVVGGITLFFLSMVAFVFWLSGLGEKKVKVEVGEEVLAQTLNGGGRD